MRTNLNPKRYSRKVAKNKFLNIILLKDKSSVYTLKLTHTESHREQDFQSNIIIYRSYLPTDTKVSDIDSSPFGADLHQHIARDNMAQSAIKTPLGVPLFWETRANPPIELSRWFGTLKMAITARDNLQVDKLLKFKPSRTELPYPTLPTYEEPFDGETADEERQRNQRNERRKVDWQNECKRPEQKLPHSRHTSAENQIQNYLIC